MNGTFTIEIILERAALYCLC